MTGTHHEMSYLGTAKTDGRRPRTVFYATCSCGRGTTVSASAESARRKIARHQSGDDSGMYREGRAGG